MINFCNFKGRIVACDENTIRLHNLKVIYSCSDEEYMNAGQTYHIENGEVVLGLSEKEKAQQEIYDLKIKLADTDYKAMKFAEGLLSADEYAETKAQRQEWRDRINEMEAKYGL